MTRILVAITILAGLLFSTSQIQSAELNADRAYGYLQQICELGRRYSGSPGMVAQQKLLTDHFVKLGAVVQRQEFEMTHPLDGSRVPLVNLFARWNPAVKQRLLVCCHYDTRPYPDQDLLNRRGLFVGANDGASGVAVLMELAHSMSELPEQLGVDFVFFDAEELVFGRTGEYFVGSTHFAQTYKNRAVQTEYLAGVLLDMVGDRKLAIYRERNSMKLAREVTDEIWETARRMQVREFVNRTRHEIRDDHLPLNQIAGIPTTDIIDFDYPHWHTTRDVPANCSGSSLVTVGRVVFGWLQTRAGLEPDVRIR